MRVPEIKYKRSNNVFFITCVAVYSHAFAIDTAFCAVPRRDESTGTPFSNCAGSYNNLVPRGAKMSALDMTQKVFFECLCMYRLLD